MPLDLDQTSRFYLIARSGRRFRPRTLRRPRNTPLWR